MSLLDELRKQNSSTAATSSSGTTLDQIRAAKVNAYGQGEMQDQYQVAHQADNSPAPSTSSGLDNFIHNPIVRTLFPVDELPNIHNTGEAVSAALDYLFKKNPVARVVNYPFAKTAEYAYPNVPFIGQREDGTYGALPGPTVREYYAQQEPVASTGSQVLDKAGDVVGQFVGPMVGTYGSGVGKIPGLIDSALTNAGVQFGTGVGGKIAKGVVEGSLAGAPMNAAATLATEDPTLSQLAQSADQGLLFGGVLGGAGVSAGAALPAIGRASQAAFKSVQDLRNQGAFKSAIQDFMDRTQRPAEGQPAFPSDRNVLQLPSATEPMKGTSFPDNIPRPQTYQKEFQQAAPEPTNLDELLKARGFNESTPVNIASVFNSKDWYHGTGTDKLTAEMLDPMLGSHESLFGHGVYLTDNPTIAEGYSKNKGRRSGTPTVYRANVNVNRVLDLEKPVSPDVADVILRSAEPLDYAYEQHFGEKNHFTDMLQKDMSQTGATPETVIQKLRDEVRDFSHEAQIPTSDFVENFQDLLVNLKRSGYDAITHTGGVRTGHDPHRVMIMLDPQNVHGEQVGPRQVTSFVKHEGAAAKLAPSVSSEAAGAAAKQSGETKLTTLDQIRQSALPDNAQPMRSELVKFRNASVQNDRTITRKQLLDNARKRHGVTVRFGRLGVGDKGVLGYFKTRSEVIRTRRAGDVQTLSHELGHALDKRYKLAQQQFDHELMRLGEETSAPDYTPEQVRAEGIAEYVRLYLTDPQRALQEAPDFTAFFRSKLPQKEMKALQATQQDVDTWITQGGANRLRGQINRTGKDTSRTVGQRVHEGYTAVVDRLHPLAVVEKMVNQLAEGAAKLRDGANSLYKKARLVAGAPRKAELFIDEHLKPILKELGDKGYKLADLGDYAAARHAMELENAWQRDFKVNVKAAAEQAAQEGKQLTLKDVRRIKEESRIESGFVRGDIQDTIQKFDTPEMNAIHQKLMVYNNKLIDMLVDGEMLSREAAAAMRAKYPDYVPFYRYFEEDGGAFFSSGGGKGFADLTNPIKRLKGSTRDIVDPIESVIKNTFAAVSAVEKNKVGLELANLAKVEGAGKFVERLTGDTRAPKENIVTVFENGERVQYQLEPELYRAIKQLDEESANFLVKMFAAPAGALRAGATLTPEFILRNPIRDQFHAFVVSNYGYNPIIDLPAGLFHAVFKGKYYKEWIEAGGAHGQYVSMDRNVLRHQLRQLKDERNPWAKATTAIVSPKQWVWLLRKLSELSEEGTKVGEFRRAVKRGATAEEAAFQSRDLMDFSRVGNSVKQINRVVTFLNANLQGKDRIARAFIEHPVRSTVRAVTAVTLPTIGIYYLNKAIGNKKQQETIDNAPQWLRDTFFLIAVPGTDVVARIPKPFDLAPVYSNWVEEALRFHDGKEHLSPADTAKMAGKELVSMPVMLTGLTPWIENMSNYSFFTGSPIVPRRDQDLLPEDQYGVGTSLTARQIGKATNYSPYKVDNVIRGYGAGLGRYATAGTDAILKAAGTGRTPPPEAKNISELPVINAFTVNYSGGKTTDDFYKRLDEMSRVEASNSKNDVKDAAAKKVSDDFQKTSLNISKLRAQMRKVQESYDIPPKEKRAQIDDIDAKITQLAGAALERNKSYTRR